MGAFAQHHVISNHGCLHRGDRAWGITPAQKQNRQFLADAMRHAEFNNYPAQWWHWSYGDRMWAAYQCKKYALYGEVNSSDYILTDNEKSVLAQYQIIS